MFGAPAVATVTMPGEHDYATVTVTESYSTVIVDISTTTSTYETTSTSYTDVLETTTAYTETLTATSTAVVTGPTLLARAPTPTSIKRRRPCRTPAPFPIASGCTNLAQYSSACGCINAVASTSTVTIPGDATTSTSTETLTVTVPSTSSTVTTEVSSTLIVEPVTSTLTSTVDTVTATTTILTSTITSVNPSPTGTLYFADGVRAGKPLVVVSNYVQWANTGSGTPFALSTYGGSPSLVGQSSVTLHLHSATSAIGVLYFETAAQAAVYNDPLVTCSITPQSGIVVCQSSTGQHTKLFQCGAYIYLAAPTWNQSGCLQVNLKIGTS